MCNVLDYGLYKPSFEFANSDLYKAELSKLRDLQKQYIKNDGAAYGNTNWQVNGSAAQGRTMVNNYKKLLLTLFLLSYNQSYHLLFSSHYSIDDYL